MNARTFLLSLILVCVGCTPLIPDRRVEQPTKLRSSNSSIDKRFILAAEQHELATLDLAELAWEAATSLASQNNTKKALYFLGKSQAILEQQGYHSVYLRRKAEIQLLIANSYANLNQFNLANSLYKSALSNLQLHSANFPFEQWRVDQAHKMYLEFIRQGNLEL